MRFDAVKGQSDAVSFLESSLKNDRLSHAYIFSGPRGVGKFLAALSFARAIVGTDLEAHPDIFILKPEKEGGNIKIDDVRQLIKDIYLKPFQAKKKVYIIDEAQAMKHEAANALLKTLEEPPTDSVLILVTDELKALFHTIVSRSQVVRFYALKPDEIKDVLVKERSLDPAKAHILSRLGSGSLGKALEYNDEEIFLKRTSLIEGLSKRPGLGSGLDETPKEKLKMYLDILLAWFRDILTAKAGADDSMLVNIDRVDSIRKEAARLTFERIEDIINSIISTMDHFDKNANQKLAMSVLGMKLSESRTTND